QLALNLQHKGGLGLVIGVVSGKEIGEKFPVFVNRIDRCAKESGLATKSSHRGAIRSAKRADRESGFGFHGSEISALMTSSKAPAAILPLIRMIVAAHLAVEPKELSENHRPGVVFTHIPGRGETRLTQLAGGRRLHRIGQSYH